MLRIAIIIVLTLLAFAVAPGCRATIGDTTLLARPAFRIPPRATPVGDGEQIFIEGYEPLGDSFMVVIRLYPKAEQKKRFKIPGMGNMPQALKRKLFPFGN